MSPLNTQIIPLEDVPQETGPDRRPLLLIVDDEPLVADTLSAILQREGFNVMKAYNGLSALKLAATRTPEMMITDVTMPGMNGVQLASTMRELCPDCKILLFSGNNASGKLLAESGHEFHLLAKPVHPTDMVNYISRELNLPKVRTRPVPPAILLAQGQTA